MINHPFVDRQLMEKVLSIRERTFEDHLFSESVNVTDLYYKTLNYTEDEIIMSVIAALELYPNKVYQVLAYDREELVRKGKTNEKEHE